MKNTLLLLSLCFLCAGTLSAQYIQGTLQGGPPTPGTKSRSPLNSLERTVNIPGAAILTDSFGNQRFTTFPFIFDTCVNYNPQTQHIVGLPYNVYLLQCGTDSAFYVDYNHNVFYLGNVGTQVANNWYTTNDTTTDATRTAYIFQNAEWLSVDPSGYIDMKMGDVAYGELYLDANQSSLYHVDLGGSEQIKAVADGVEITTSNSASRAVDITTDTMNWASSFDPTYLHINYLADTTYMYADSLKLVALGQFPHLDGLVYDGTEKGFLYWPNGPLVTMVNGNGTTGTYTYNQLTDVESKAIASDPVNQLSGTETLGLSYWEIDLRDNINVSQSNISSIISDHQSQTTIANTVGGNNNTAILATNYVDNDTSKYAAMLREIDNGDYFTAAYLGVHDMTGLVFRSLTEGFGVQTTFSTGSKPSYDWLRIDLEGGDTTINAIQFYNDRYRWKNGMPSTAAGDTSFHYWAGNGAGGTVPGFMTIDQVCSHCSAAAAVNIFNSSGYTTDKTRIDTIQETITFLSFDGQADGVYPFRFELQDAIANEPEMMVWDFPGAGDSLTLGQSDQEITFHSSNEFLLWSDQFLALQADSILLESNSIETVTTANFILAGNGANTIMKKIDASAATAGDVIASNGTKWVVTTPNTTTIHEYTTAQTGTSLAVPSGAKSCEIICIGAGGGGGSGREGAAGSVRTGGGGGGAGGISYISISTAALGATLTINVGTGGTGGAAQSTNDTNGNSGSAGTASSVTNGSDILCFANLGSGGAGGSTGAAAGGSSQSGSDFAGSAGAASGATGGAGSPGSTSSTKAPSGGGAGGGVPTTNVGTNGSNGGSLQFGQTVQSNRGLAGGTFDGSAGFSMSSGQGNGGGGGGGGAGLLSTGPGIGGNGVRGGGGGGGGASTNGTASGAGGNGGDGYVRITFYF